MFAGCLCLWLLACAVLNTESMEDSDVGFFEGIFLFVQSGLCTLYRTCLVVMRVVHEESFMNGLSLTA